MIRAGQTAPVQLLVDGSMSNMTSSGWRIPRRFWRNSTAKNCAGFIPWICVTGGSMRASGPVQSQSRQSVLFCSRHRRISDHADKFIFTSIAIIGKRRTAPWSSDCHPIRSYEFIIGKTIPISSLPFATVCRNGVAVYWFEIPFKGSFLLLLRPPVCFF